MTPENLPRMSISICLPEPVERILILLLLSSMDILLSDPTSSDVVVALDSSLLGLVCCYRMCKKQPRNETIEYLLAWPRCSYRFGQTGLFRFFYDIDPTETGDLDVNLRFVFLCLLLRDVEPTTLRRWPRRRRLLQFFVSCWWCRSCFVVVRGDRLAWWQVWQIAAIQRHSRIFASQLWRAKNLKLLNLQYFVFFYILTAISCPVCYIE